MWAHMHTHTCAWMKPRIAYGWLGVSSLEVEMIDTWAIPTLSIRSLMWTWLQLSDPTQGLNARMNAHVYKTYSWLCVIRCSLDIRSESLELSNKTYKSEDEVISCLIVFNLYAILWVWNRVNSERILILGCFVLLFSALMFWQPRNEEHV